jgi:hypothetical protein
MPYKPSEIEKMLLNKLHMYFEDRDHRWFRLDLDQLPPIRTKLSSHKEDIGSEIENRICKQLRIRKILFHELMDCTKQLDDYKQQVRTDPFPPFNIRLV